jgi:hypothetical protein
MLKSAETWNETHVGLRKDGHEKFSLHSRSEES